MKKSELYELAIISVIADERNHSVEEKFNILLQLYGDRAVAKIVEDAEGNA